MSRYCGDVDSGPILDAAARWREVALLKDGSVFTDRQLWTLEGFEALERHFIQNLDEGEGSFMDKLRRQLAPTSASVKQLAAEVIWIMQLAPSNTLPPRKRELVRIIWNWSEESLPVTAEPSLTDAVLSGIGSGGPGYNNNRWRELSFCINAVLALKRLPGPEASRLVAAPLDFAQWLESVPDASVRQFRHMLLYLLFPDTFERIFGKSDRQLIAQAFSGLSRQAINAQSPLELDQTLRRAREELETKYGTKDLDFYRPPLREQWNRQKFGSMTQGITAEHVLQALADIDRDGVPAGARSTFYDLVHASKHYPPKLVLSLAVKHARGTEFDRDRFSGGESSSAFRLLRSLGFDIVSKGVGNAETTALPVGEEPYSLQDACDGLFIETDAFFQLVDRLRNKKNMILQGPPGVGKTFFARRLAYALIGSQDKGRVGMVQFHPTYAYEDFVQGYRPSGTGFVLKNGLFYDFCRRAQSDPEHAYVFIIDEINRGNLSKVFGELMMLIEADKRGPEWAIPLTYSSTSEETFYVPANLYLLGLMNTADRSLAMVDYALRRRFVFLDLAPGFETPQFAEHLREAGASEDLVYRIGQDMRSLNAEIAGDRANLGPGFCVGHSFFCSGTASDGATLEWYREVIRSEILPLLREYWFDDASKVEAWERRLLEA